MNKTEEKQAALIEHVISLIRKRRSEAQKKQIELASELENSDQLAFVLTDPSLKDNPIIYTNSYFQTMTGYSKSEIVGRNCRFLQGEGSESAEIERLRQAIKDEKPITVLITNYRKDGSSFMNQLVVSPVFAENGSLLNFMGVQAIIE